MDVFSIAAGAAGVGVIYFLYLVATKGLPAALSWAKAKWNAGKAGLSALQGDVEGISGKLTSLEQEIKSRLATVESAVVSLKAPAAAQPAAAPSAPAPAAG